MGNPDIGKLSRQAGLETRQRVFEWFVRNPCRTRAEAAEALDLSLVTVSRHAAAIRRGWRPWPACADCGRRVVDPGHGKFMPCRRWVASNG